MKVVALAGGVGGARLAQGLAQTGVDLTIVVNTGDDFTHLGLKISPDIDTVTYTLAGIANRAQGWGVDGETTAAMEQIRRLGGEDWFLLGDRDLALHILRTARLNAGATLSQVTAEITAALGITAKLLSMTDDPVATIVTTPAGDMAFQHWFVRERATPQVTGLRFEGIAKARPAPGVITALQEADLIVFCPSNPYLSLDPILQIAGIRQAMRAPVVAVSPIIGGQAVKGPAASLMRDHGREVSPRGIAQHFDGIIDGLVIDHADAALATDIGLPVRVTKSLMTSDADRLALANCCLRLGMALINDRAAPARARA